jgi:Tfp pilus assembly protein PilX
MKNVVIFRMTTSRQRGAALIIVLAFIVLLTGLVVA